MSVTEIKKISYLDVPAKLRELADQAETAQKGGTPYPSLIMILGYPGGNVAVRGFGEQTSPLQMAGWLARGLTAMTQNCSMDFDFEMGAPKPPGAA